jgi:L-alanine-DL-glutamate epimerase-like enolase superfamily enzyme
MKDHASRRKFIAASAVTALTAALAPAASDSAASKAIGAEPSVTLGRARRKLKITNLKCAILGNSPVIRITTSEGITGYGQAEEAKPYLKPHVLFYKDLLVGEDPTDVERVLQKIRHIGGFKPWGSAVSAIEMALWDIAGRAAGLPVYKLLGGKVRDRVRVYNGGVRSPMTGQAPDDYAQAMAMMKGAKERFTIIKQAVGFHSRMPGDVPNFFYGEIVPGSSSPSTSGKQPAEYAVPTSPPQRNRGPLTEHGLKHIVACVEAMKRVLGDEIGLALDCGPGFAVADAIRLAKALEPLSVLWLEDLLTGDYTPYVMADLYRDLTQSTSSPIHTGEQIYLRQNYRELIERNAVRVIGPDPADIGGLAELKWVAEYADLHGILVAPHGIFNGLIGLAAQVQVCATLPQNFIAFEYPVARPAWWYDIVVGLPNPIVTDGLIDVWDRPGLGVELNAEAARRYLREEDRDFFD